MFSTYNKKPNTFVAAILAFRGGLIGLIASIALATMGAIYMEPHSFQMGLLCSFMSLIYIRAAGEKERPIAWFALFACALAAPIMFSHPINFEKLFSEEAEKSVVLHWPEGLRQKAFVPDTVSGTVDRLNNLQEFGVKAVMTNKAHFVESVESISSEINKYSPEMATVFEAEIGTFTYLLGITDNEAKTTDAP